MTLDEMERCLREAASLVRQGWSQGAEARDWTGTERAVDAADATHWSLGGALRKVCGERGHDDGVADRLARVVCECNVQWHGEWPDGWRQGAEVAWARLAEVNDRPGRTRTAMANALLRAAQDRTRMETVVGG